MVNSVPTSFVSIKNIFKKGSNSMYESDVLKLLKMEQTSFCFIIKGKAFLYTENGYLVLLVPFLMILVQVLKDIKKKIFF